MEVFQGREKLVDLDFEIDAIRKKVKELATQPCTEAMDVEAVMAAFNKLRQLFREGMPFTLCDCAPYDNDCPKCDGRKWINATKYHLTQHPRLTSV